MPDALRWLWRDYPQRIEARQPQAMGQPGWDPRAQVYGVIQPGKPWEPVAGSFQSIGGLASTKSGRVYVSDPVAGRIYAAEGGKAGIFKEKSGGAGALRAGADGRLYASQPAAHRIVSYGDQGDERVVARDVDAIDLALTMKNGIYYVDSPRKAIGYIDATGKKRTVCDGRGMTAPVAVSLSPDQSLLLVADAQSRFNWSFQILGDGSLVSGEPFYRVDLAEASTRGSTGVTVDSTGQAYFATALGIQLCEQNGRCAAIIAKPEPGDLSAIAFGGQDLGSLYAVVGHKLFRREVKTRGVEVTTRVKPPRPPL